MTKSFLPSGPDIVEILLKGSFPLNTGCQIIDVEVIHKEGDSEILRYVKDEEGGVTLLGSLGGESDK